MRRILPIVLALSTLLASGAGAALPLRPYSGCAVLLLPAADEGEQLVVPIYAEPGLERLAETDVQALPRLKGDRDETLIAVSATRGEWLRVAYDDAGREGWIAKSRAWEYRAWEEFFPGRLLRVLPGLKKGCYSLRGEPREGSPEWGTLARDQQVRVLRGEGDWALIQAPSGWFRWRDADGRLTVALP